MMQASKEMLVFFWHKLWNIKITPFMWQLHVQTRTRTNHNSSFSRQRRCLPFPLFPLPFWSLWRSLNIPFIWLALLKARERWQVLRARKRRARVLSSRVHRYLVPFISYPPATQVISQDKLVKLGCQMTSRWMHAHFWKKYWKTFSLQRGVYYTLYLIMPYRGNVWQIIGIFYIYRVLLNFSFCDRCARKVTYSSVCWE